MFATFVYQLLDEPVQVLEHVESNRAHCAAHDIKQWEGLLSLFEAWSNHRLGLNKGVTSQMKQGIAQWVGIDGTALVPYISTILIETLTEEGELEDALTTADDAIRLAERIGERMSLPELHRLRGEALLHRDHKAARQSFEQALSIAGEIGAKGWEQRATKSLSRMEDSVGVRHDHTDEGFH
jgi:predicted ATPase